MAGFGVTPEGYMSFNMPVLFLLHAPRKASYFDDGILIPSMHLLVFDPITP